MLLSMVIKLTVVSARKFDGEYIFSDKNPVISVKSVVNSATPMNPRPATYTLLVVLLATCLIFGSLSSSAGPDEPASQGRPITPAGTLVQDLTTRQTAVGALPVAFVRTPDKTGPGGEGRFLLSVNSGYGLQFNAAANRGQQSLSVIDLNAKPAAVVQNVYFPSPQSVNVGVVFAPKPQEDGSYELYVSGGLKTRSGSSVFSQRVELRSRLRRWSKHKRRGSFYRREDLRLPQTHRATTAIALRSIRPGLRSSGRKYAFRRQQPGDSLGIVEELNGARKLVRVDLRHGSDDQRFIYPYSVVVAWHGLESLCLLLE